MWHSKLDELMKDAEGIQKLSAYLQDAIFYRSMSHYEKQTFRMIVNRFCWETPPYEGLYHRAHASVAINYVTKIERKNLEDPVRPFNILNIQMESDNILIFNFSGASCLRMNIEQIYIRITDLHDSWGSPSAPSHD